MASRLNVNSTRLYDSQNASVPVAPDDAPLSKSHCHRQCQVPVPALGTRAGAPDASASDAGAFASGAR
jgi:hypothetical protein